jgi:predicted metal-dependent hydrolase
MLINACLFNTLEAMEDHKRKKRAENQTASLVKKTSSINMAHEITQAITAEPTVTHTTMSSLIDERIKNFKKQTARNIATEA